MVRTLLIFLVLLTSAALAGGCNGPRTDYMAPHRLDHGLVFCLDGVGGYNIGPKWVRDGLDAGGVEAAISVLDWGHGPGGLFVADLVDEEGNRRRAGELARLVENYRRSWPGRPVTLIGHSGGAGIVVFALEQLAPGVRVDAAFLLAPALDPGRNLAPALEHVAGPVLATYSAADVALMGLGTSTFGTMDRKHTVGAGLVGFRLPDGLPPEDREQYGKLRQAGWSPGLLASGHLGGHMGWASPGFARQFIAPVIRGDAVPEIFKPVLPQADQMQDVPPAAGSAPGQENRS
jgi:pimeloyl-ACP methyl ester carboxylesterase